MKKVFCPDLAPALRRNRFWNEERDQALREHVETFGYGLIDPNILGSELGLGSAPNTRLLIRKRLREMGLLPGMLTPDELRVSKRQPYPNRRPRSKKAAKQ